MIESRLESALFWFHVKPAHSHRKTLTMPHTPVRRCTLWLSDSLCFSDTRNSINASQSRCICHALPPQQYAFHPIGRHVLNGRPPASTQQRHPVGPHVLQAHVMSASGEEESSAAHPAAWSHGFSARFRLRNLWEHFRRTRRYWFHVKPAHGDCVGITAAPTSPCSPCSREWSAQCISCRCLACPIQP